MSRLDWEAFAAAWLVAFFALPAPVQAEEAEEVVVDRLHSALPLYT